MHKFMYNTNGFTVFLTLNLKQSDKITKTGFHCKWNQFPFQLEFRRG